MAGQVEHRTQVALASSVIDIFSASRLCVRTMVRFGGEQAGRFVPTPTPKTKQIVPYLVLDFANGRPSAGNDFAGAHVGNVNHRNHVALTVEHRWQCVLRL